MTLAGALKFVTLVGCGLVATGIVLAGVAAIAFWRSADLRDHRWPR